MGTRKPTPSSSQPHHHPAPKGSACSTCKARKVRCGLQQPACEACIRSARHEGRDPSLVVCSYGAGAKCGTSGPASSRATKPAKARAPSVGSDRQSSPAGAEVLELEQKMVEFEKRVRANLKALPPAPAPAVPSSPSLPVDFSVLSRRTSTHASASTSRPPPLASSAAPPMPTPAGLHNSPTILHPTAPYAAAAAAAAWPIFTPLEQPLSHSPVSIDFSATYPSFAAAPESPDSLLSYESSHWASSSSSDTDQLLFTPPPPLYEPYEELPEHFTHAEGAKETLALPLFFPLPPKSFGQDPPYGSDVLFGLDDWTFGGDLMSY